jgi:hypothetical protein
MSGNRFKSKLARFMMYRELKSINRSGEVVSYSNAGSIGILYNATADKDYELIKEYVKSMRAQSKDVIALGYFDKQELPSMRFMKLGLDFFTRKALNWKLKPSNPIVNNFIQRNFDILICLNIDQNIPLRYISALAKARFKVGKYESGIPPIYDLQIKVEEPVTLRQMIEQVNHYLNLIRNDQYQKA